MPGEGQSHCEITWSKAFRLANGAFIGLPVFLIFDLCHYLVLPLEDVSIFALHHLN